MLAATELIWETLAVQACWSLLVKQAIDGFDLSSPIDPTSHVHAFSEANRPGA